ncbi:MAG: transglutaminase-like domain-containing protein [Chloroflexota bacterium]|nr:transglutaminase-like domain-containing protein [Chloroflexota bacterium]
MRRICICIVFSALMLTVLIPGCSDSKDPSPSPTPTAMVSPETAHPWVGEEQYFALKIDDQIIGYNNYKVSEEKQYNGQNTLVVEGHTMLQVNMPGSRQVSTYQTVTYLDTDLFPAYYALEFSDGTQDQKVEIEFENGIAHASAEVGGKTIENDVSLSLGALIMDGNVFEHYVFLFRALKLNKGQTANASILMPQMMTMLDAKFVAGASPEVIASNGKSYEALSIEANITGLPLQQFWVTEDGELIKMALPSQDFVMEKTDESVIDEVQGADILALLEDKFTTSNIPFSSMNNVVYMKAEIDVAVVGENLELDFISTRDRNFKGTIQNNRIKGSIENRVVEYSGAEAPSYPFEPSDELNPYLEPEAKAESDDPLIVEKANEITAGTQNAWEAARAIAEWVHENIRYQITASGARQALIDSKGDCGPQAYLTIAMCRAVGIPARLVGGFAYGNGQFGQHYWVECYMGKKNGWIPFDSTVGEYGWIDAAHVRLFQNGAIETLTSVQVIDYVEKGEAPQAQRRELNLSVGQQINYAFTEHGKDRGYIRYTITGAEEQEGNRIYTVLSQMHTESTSSCKPTSATATFHLDRTASPVSYESKSSIGHG